MKKYLITYNIVILLVGNILFSTVHYLDEHTHSSDYNECLECLYFEHNSNYTCCEDELSFSNNDTGTILLSDLAFIKSVINKKFRSRAPPLP